jgi:anthranilate phosphoribosyltransferase
MMKQLLEQLFQHRILSEDEAFDILIRISNREFSDAQVMAFMTVFQMRPITVDELSGFRKALLQLCIPVDLSEFDTIDMCGTGGDGKNTFNISTLASFVVAGAGYKVAKHGNYGVSSVSGSSNVLEALGYRFTNDQVVLQQQLRDAHITFLHAPVFHPAMAAVAPIRKQLKMKTFFNMLGPVVNPSRPNNQLTGVFSRELSRLYQYMFEKDKGKKFAVIYGLDGYDEVSLTGKFLLRTHRSEQLFSPDDLDLPQIRQQDIYGGNSVDEAAAIFMNILQGKGTTAQNNVVCANAALAIQVMNDFQMDFSQAFGQALESLLSGAAKKSLQTIVE